MSPSDPSIPARLLDAFRSSRRFLLSSHVHPDGDAIGSEVALARLLAGAGKSATIWNADPVPDSCLGVTADWPIHTGRTPPADYPGGYDLAVPLECPQLHRTGLEQALERLPILNIDHHMGNDGYGMVSWVDTEAPAVAEMLLRLARALDWPVDQPTATALYLGLATDTGSFRFANATQRAFEAAAELVGAGARPEQIARWVYESNSPGTVRLLAEMLDTLAFHADARVASVRLDLAMFERAGARPTDSEGLIDHPRRIRGVEAVALFRQQTEGGVKVSLRSRGDVDVGAIATKRGGGGHRNAAGCEVDDRATEAAVLADLVAAVEAVAGGREGFHAEDAQ